MLVEVPHCILKWMGIAVRGGRQPAQLTLWALPSLGDVGLDSWVHHGEGSAAGADPSHWGGLLPHRGVAQGWCVVSTLGSCCKGLPVIL